MGNKFKTYQEIEEYLNHDKIECLECGKKFTVISWSHLSKKHDMTPDEYRLKYDLPISTPLAGKSFREWASRNIKLLDKSGVLNRDIDNARKKSRLSPKFGKRTETESTKSHRRHLVNNRGNMEWFGTKRGGSKKPRPTLHKYMLMIDGITKNISHWANDIGVNQSTVRNWLYRNNEDFAIKKIKSHLRSK